MNGCELERLEHRKSLLFVNKKKQKNFFNLELACTGLQNVGSRPFEQKFFASFFQKRCYLPSLQPIDLAHYTTVLHG